MPVGQVTNPKVSFCGSSRACYLSTAALGPTSPPKQRYCFESKKLFLLSMFYSLLVAEISNIASRTKSHRVGLGFIV